jgi:Leucine-rich repeat (LRR) protein
MAMHSRDLPEALKRIAAELVAQTGSLDLSRLQLNELPAELQELTSLQNLDCSFTQVSDLEPLRGLTSLQNLDCWGTEVSDLEPLRGLANLQVLTCSYTQVSDLEPLVGLQTLKTLVTIQGAGRAAAQVHACSPMAERAKKQCCLCC